MRSHARRFYCAIHGTLMNCIVGNAIHCGNCLGCHRNAGARDRHVHHEKI